MTMQAGLSEVLARYGTAYLATVGADMRAHLVTVNPRLRGAELVIEGPGRTTSRNVAHNATVSLVWPPTEVGGYSLMVDGVGSSRDGVLVVAPTRAVLHRAGAPGLAQSEGRCAADCIEVTVPDRYGSREAAPSLTPE
jgi:hypothetical protein